MAEHDIAVLDKILEFLGFTIAINKHSIWPYRVLLISKRQVTSQSLGKSMRQTMGNLVYFFIEDQARDQARSDYKFKSYDEILHGILTTPAFIVPESYDEYEVKETKVLSNPFYKLTKEEAVIKVDLER